ncbi:ArsR/SmtB family transcription factor [Yinghuangia soli]|uniref:Winged helix-turn-helix domain-containing protein n=1 Tax=Yinghuangia soli TaxID=2908204 RepID=A0AA41U799_9ACTN|nr:winged helix-turn-helix domain-containing protein [Yinghuangia soli]MCF2533837.1 winged helix-turn-helix domain-containing protein [Yinghuangia soli]
MGCWEINVDTLAGSRFVVSPMAEVDACWLALAKSAAAHPGERRWLDAHLPAYHGYLAANPAAAALAAAALGKGWIADFMTPPPAEETVEDALAKLRRLAPEQVRADLLVALGPRPMPEILRDRDDIADVAADLLAWVWTHAVEPTWPTRRRVMEADMIARMGRLGRGGWAAALDDMRPGTRWLGGGRLRINALDYPDRDVTDAQMLFVPVTMHQWWVSWEGETRYAVVYPCSGTLAEADRRPAAPQALARLLGRARAEVLVRLDSPLSTTQLVALTGQTLGAVGGHLKVLSDAGLVARRRAGRSVLYFRTETGMSLMAAQT